MNYMMLRQELNNQVLSFIVAPLFYISWLCTHVQICICFELEIASYMGNAPIKLIILKGESVFKNSPALESPLPRRLTFKDSGPEEELEEALLCFLF